MQRMAKGPEMGPAILASGYLAKRTRTLGRWKKRWWQLTDDGTLIYFKNEERTKALGEIDVARSCYEVKCGADQCKVDFPGAVPDCCCFSFSVLKRTYYMYAASPADAKLWTESIASLSNVLNYNKKNRRPAPVQPKSPPPRPASAMCVSSSTAMRGGSEEKVIGKRRYTMPDGRLPKVRASISGDVTYSTVAGLLEEEATDKPTELPRINKPDRGKPYHRGGAVSTGNRYGSAPNLFFGTGARGKKRSSPTHQNQRAVNSRLWLDGSPPPNSRTAVVGKRTRRKHGPKSLQQQTTPQHVPRSGSLDRLQVTKRTPVHVVSSNQQLITRWPVDMEGYELPPRPQSVDVSLPSAKRSLNQRQKLAINASPLSQSLSSIAQDISKSQARSVESRPPVKPKPILKKSRAIQSPEREFILVSSNGDSSPPEIPPKTFSLKVSVNSESGQRSVFLPPPPNFKPPPPPERSSGTSSPSLSSTTTETKIGSTTTTENVPAVLVTNPPGTISQNRDNSRAAEWFSDPATYLKLLRIEIRRVGMQQMDGSICTTFRKLQKETMGLFPDLIGVLMLARRYKIVSFTGSTLVEGRDDGALITLHGGGDVR